MRTIGFILCGIAGGLAYYFGGWGGLAAVVIGEIGMVLE